MPIPSNPKDRDKLKGMIAEITNCMLRIDGEREQMKEIITDAAEKFEIDKKLVRKIATTMYKANYADLQAENEEFELLYETLVEGRRVDAEAA